MNITYNHSPALLLSVSSLNLSLSSRAKWGIFPVITLTVNLVAMILNGALLLIFMRNQKLRTPFGKLLMNLLFANFTYTMCTGFLNFIANLYSIWWLDYHWCTFYLYGSYCFTFVVVFSHVLITCDRLWAVTFPVSFSRNFTHKAANIMCVLPWLLSNLLVLPGISLESMFYRRVPLELHGCNVNLTVFQLKVWTFACTLLSFLCTIVILGAYPYIYVKEQRRTKARSPVAPVHVIKSLDRKTLSREFTFKHSVTKFVNAGKFTCYLR